MATRLLWRDSSRGFGVWLVSIIESYGKTIGNNQGMGCSDLALRPSSADDCGLCGVPCVYD